MLENIKNVINKTNKYKKKKQYVTRVVVIDASQLVDITVACTSMEEQGSGNLLVNQPSNSTGYRARYQALRTPLPGSQTCLACS